MTAWLLCDGSGQVISEKDADARHNPASLAKLVLLHLVFRDLGFDQRLTVPETAVVRREKEGIQLTNMRLSPGQAVSVMDLVLGMIVPSANDAADTICSHLFPRDPLEGLNRAVAELGLNHTRLASASGVGDEGRTTARDMITLARRVHDDYPQYRSLFGIGSFAFNGRRWRNTNDLLFSYKGATGLKTGTTGSLRRNLAAVAERDGTRLFVVVLNAPDKPSRNQAAIELLDQGFGERDGKPRTGAAAAPRTVNPPAPDPSSSPWKIDGLARALEVDPPGGDLGDTPIRRFQSNAPSCAPGDVFVAIPAKNARMNKRARTALAKGAVCIVTEGDALDGDLPVLRVPDLTAALTDLARRGRDRFNGKVICVTGSVGKTTTKDMLAHCLSHAGATHHTLANLNADISNLASVASLPADARYAVFELSLSEQGAVGRKSAVCRPHAAILTGVGFSHGVHFKGDPSAILRQKTKMFKWLEEGGVAVLPSGDRHFADMRDRAMAFGRVERVITCGSGHDDTVRLIDCRLGPTASEVTISVEGRDHSFTISQPGRHFVNNALLAAGGLLAVGADPGLLSGLSGFVPTARRLERFRVPAGDGVLELIDDAYNAAPDSVRALLDILRMRPDASRRVLVLGDMLELGPKEERLHLDLAPDIAAAGVDLLVTVGPLTAKLATAVDLPVHSFADAAAASDEITSLVRDRDLVAVKGSHGMKLGLIVKVLKGRGQDLVRSGMDWHIEREPVDRG